MKPNPPIRPDRAAPARAVEGYRLVTPRYSCGIRTVYRRSDQRYVSHVVADCATEHAARALARKLNRLDRYERGVDIPCTCKLEGDFERFVLVVQELEKARRKHPKFVDRFSTNAREVLERALDDRREINAVREKQNWIDFTTILEEERLEALVEYKAGRRSRCLRELAQCAAVCLRAMEYVQKEMEKTKC